MKLKVSRILHAGYLFECEGTTIAFDPIFENPFSRNCYAFPAVRFDVERIRALELDAVFLSHFHDDHCSLTSLDLLDQRTPIYLFCVFPELAQMIRELGFTQVRQLTLGAPVVVGSFEVVPLPALDVDVDSLFHVKAAGLDILNVVDSWIPPDSMKILSRVAAWDLVLWPFQTMRELEVLSPLRAEPATGDLPAEWREQLKQLRPRVLVPSSCQFVHESWSWYNQALFPISYRRFENEMAKLLPSTRVMRLDPAASIQMDKQVVARDAPLSWVQPLEPPDVDYEYLPALKPPSTSEIARRFPPLTRDQADFVLRFCRDELPVKYGTLEPGEDAYFAKSLIWKLSLHDSSGARKDFHYRIESDRMVLVPAESGPTGWLTEIPIFKLHSALTTGESLTSLYLRINDLTFAESVEAEVRRVDITEDPLIRCLFTGEFGAYQRYQLAQLIKEGTLW